MISDAFLMHLDVLTILHARTLVEDAKNVNELLIVVGTSKPP